MSGKSKFQISRSLDERIRRLFASSAEQDSEFAQVDRAFILGFNYGNVTNYLGLTTDYQLYSANLHVVGLVLFKDAHSSDDDIKASLEKVREYSRSPDGLGSYSKTDKNEHLFLVYSSDESNEVTKRIFNLDEGNSNSTGDIKLSVLDADKLYNHSAITKVNISLKLNIFQNNSNKLLDKAKLQESFTSLQQALGEPKKLKLHVADSNYSTSYPVVDKNLTETLYNHLDVPKDVEQAGDYLPQLTKEDKKKLGDKWRNKVKDKRAPLEINLEHEDYSFTEEDTGELSKSGFYPLKLSLMVHIQMNDPISKSFQCILGSLRQLLSLTCHSLCQKQASSSNSASLLQPDQLKVCNFRPSSLAHFVPAVYVISDEDETLNDYAYLKNLRKDLHCAYLLPTDQPQFRYSQRVTNVSLRNSDEDSGFLCNVHTDILDKSGIKGGSRNVIGGTYTYHHYMQNRFNDNGWGCAYRSLQTIISWFKHQGYIYSPDVEPRKTSGDDKSSPSIESIRRLLARESRVPTHEEIQKTLVDVGDKQTNFIGSEKWIGSQEVCYVLNHLYNLDSKFISVSSGSELASKARDLGHHFATQSTPVMIGGGVLAHTIIGTDFNEKNGDISYLILDPHYTGAEELASIQKKGWCGWKKNNFWDKSSFYNLCLPQRPAEF